MTPEDIAKITAIVETAKGQTIEAIATMLKADMQAMLDTTVQSIATAVRADAQETARAIYARIEHVETALLTEFHKWASPLEARVRTHAAAIRAIDAEQEFQADRLSKLEGNKPDA